jgi:predicted helicase
MEPCSALNWNSRSSSGPPRWMSSAPAARSGRSRFPHVKEAIAATVKGLDGTDRGQLIMACGTGKTLAAMWIAERLGSERTLILVPSLSILAQTLREWTANATKPFDYMAVCSDETVMSADEFVPHTSELGLPSRRCRATRIPAAALAGTERGQRRHFGRLGSRG